MEELRLAISTISLCILLISLIQLVFGCLAYFISNDNFTYIFNRYGWYISGAIGFLLIHFRVITFNDL